MKNITLRNTVIRFTVISPWQLSVKKKILFHRDNILNGVLIISQAKTLQRTSIITRQTLLNIDQKKTPEYYLRMKTA